jgi:hypothetical protein
MSPVAWHLAVMRAIVHTASHENPGRPHPRIRGRSCDAEHGDLGDFKAADLAGLAVPFWASGWSEAVERPPNGDRDGCHDRRAGRSELEHALLDRKPEDVRDDHWKISVVQSPP